MFLLIDKITSAFRLEAKQGLNYITPAFRLGFITRIRKGL
jgi:hypothetical protein